MNRTLGTVFIGLFLVAWIIPVGFYGLTDSAPFWIPEFFRQRTNVSRLFFRQVDELSVYEVHFRRSQSATFNPLNESDFFQMRPFGYRTRLQRTLSLSNESQREALALWLAKKLNDRSPADPVAEMKIIRFPCTMERNAALQGHYRQPASTSVPGEQIEQIAFYDFRSGH